MFIHTPLSNNFGLLLKLIKILNILQKIYTNKLSAKPLLILAKVFADRGATTNKSAQSMMFFISF